MALPAIVLNMIAAIAASGGSDPGDADPTGDVTKKMEKLKGVADKVGTAMDRVKFSFSSLNIPVNFIAASYDLAASLEKLNITLGQTTGYTSLLGKDMIQLAHDTSTLGMSFGDSQKIVATMATEFRKFPALSQNTRQGLNLIAGQLLKVGVDSRITAKSFDIFVTSLNQTPQAAMASVKAMHKLAQEVGRSTGMVMQEFAQFSPQLLKYGERTERVFGELQKAARSYHMDMSEALQIANQFDTFEGAAEKVGSLNQVFGQFGLQLNDSTLREMNEADRIEHLGESFRDAGIEVSSMGHRMRQTLAGILTGGDQDLLGRMFGPKEEYTAYMKQQESLAETSQKFTTSMERLQGAAQKFFVDSGLIEYGTNLIKGLATALDHLDENSSYIDYFTALAGVWTETSLKPAKDFAASATGMFDFDAQGGTGGLSKALTVPPPMPVPDLYIPGADGNKNYITGPAGTFQLHAQDSIIAGTDLGSGGISPQDLQKAVATGMATALKAASSRSRPQPIEVSLDGRVIGRAVMDEIGKQMSAVVPL